MYIHPNWTNWDELMVTLSDSVKGCHYGPWPDGGFLAGEVFLVVSSVT